MLATAFIFNGNRLFLIMYSLHFDMSDKNSKITITLGLLTTIFLFQRLNWLFNDSIGFSTIQLAFQ